MPTNGPNSAQLATVGYLDGLNTNGTVASVSFGTWNGDNPATYNSSVSDLSKWHNNASGVTLSSFSVAGTAGGTVTYAFNPSDGFTAAEEQAFVACMTLWSDEANISFSLATSSTTADVLLSIATKTGTYEQGSPAFTAPAGMTQIPDRLSPTTTYGGQAQIVFDSGGSYGTLGSFSVLGGYSFSAITHEVGHLIGLGHTGPYDDGGSAGPSIAPSVQESAYDSRQWSAMSYISPQDTTAKYYSQYTVTGTDWTRVSTTTEPNGEIETVDTPVAPETPMPLDILAAQQLYGAPVTTALFGGQVFGFNCNITDASEPFFDFTKNVNPVITLWDAGTGNTLDLSGFSQSDTVNLNPGTFSSADGLTNNIGIAFGTSIDTAIGGLGSNTFILNGDSDRIVGGGSSNVVVFGTTSGSYTLSRVGTTVTARQVGSPVTDTLQNVQSLQFTNETLSSSAIAPAPDDFNGDGQSDLLLQNTNGAIVIETQSNLAITAGTSLGNPGPTWHVVGSADFNGDGQPDILLQNDNGTVVDYLMSGTTVAAGYDLTNPGSSWHVRGTGDFNGDGQSDIVLQNDNGSIVVDYTNGVSVTGGATISDPGPGWTVEGVADFNGDGQPDILLQNTNGAIVDYLMNGTTVAAGYLVANPGAGWSVAGTGNYNADSDADIVLHNDNGTDLTLYTNATSVIGSSSPTGDPGATWTGTVAGSDYNGDGVSDLLLQNTASTLVGVTLNSNAAITASAVLGTPGAGWTALGNDPVQYIDGTGGNLNLTATAGADQFNLTSFTAGLHTITGFDPAQDTVALSAASYPNFAAVQAADQAYQGGTYIGLSGNAGVLIQGVAPSQITASNFALR